VPEFSDPRPAGFGPLTGIPSVRDGAISDVKSVAKQQSSSDPTRDLMVSIANAIEDWGRRHHLENLPPDIVFEQALSALNEVYRVAQERQQRQRRGGAE